MKQTLPHYRRLQIAIATSALIQSVVSASAVEYNYNLTRDWSDTQNPNGVWSYNYNTTPISTHQTFWWGQAGWGDLWIADGSILKGFYPTGMTDPWGNLVGPPHDWQTNDVMMHALSVPYGGQSTFLNVTWTSPADGTIDIIGRAWDGEIFADRDVAWELIVGGQVIAQRNSVQGLYRTNFNARFAANLVPGQRLKNIPVTKGEVVEFRVIAMTYYGHFVGVEESITLKRPVRFCGMPVEKCKP